ncbi:MAG: RtcB family protein [Lentisphaeria bacterium]
MNVEKITDWLWRISRSGDMRVPVHIFASEALMEVLHQDQSLQQAVNIAHLPGIVKASLAMPDIHTGYGFPIGGVGAFDPENGGIISPGGIGYDINCGVRTITTDLSENDVSKRLDKLLDRLFEIIPAGVGASKAVPKLTTRELEQAVSRGSEWAIAQGYGWGEDRERTENAGCMQEADPYVVSRQAVERGLNQLGTLGAGNHFLEIDVIDEIFDEQIADTFGLKKGSISIQIHCGSRGYGHQICTDYLQVMQRAAKKYNIKLPDRQLACAPLVSQEGKDYFAAMACAANFAWANRQIVMHLVRKAFADVFEKTADSLNLRLLYDVCHNVAKYEDHLVNGVEKSLCVHRKGATRAFPAGHPEVPGIYQAAGQPVLIPGDMGTFSYILAGKEESMEQSFGSTSHGAGRLMSRKAALRSTEQRNIADELEKQGIKVRARTMKTLGEECSDAYKSISEVVQVVHAAGLAGKVAKLRPIGVIKG